MLSPIRIMHFEALGFLFALAVVVAFQLLTRQINLRGVFHRKDGTGKTSPERIQLLLATIASAAHYLTQVAQTNNGTLPDIDNNWLYLMGGSGGLYVLHKAWSTFKAAQQLGGKS